MKKAIKILSNEHKNILKMIDILLKECQEIELGKKVNKDFFKKGIDFVKIYVDKFHHSKEEDILFIELCKNETQMHCNPVQQMLYEHNLGRDFIKNLEKSLEKNNKNKIIENTKGYCQLLQEHIFKEDNILYPMAENILNSKIKKDIVNKFLKLEDKFKAKKKRYLLILKKETF